MTINQDQVVLFESERLTDEEDGGGRATGNVVVDGEVNNLFNDISRLDRTIGDVALRKAFVGIDTDNADIYLGAHAIIVQPPADPNVHVLMFDAGSEDDERAEARNRIEAYVVQGARAQFELLGNQFENQRQIVVIQREELAVPANGDVYVLRNYLGVEQYIRVTEVESSIQTFTYQTGSSFIDFVRRRIQMSISAPLDTTFLGGEASPVGTAMPSGSVGEKSEVFNTEVADAARYWGVTRSTETAEIGDVSIKALSVYANLVPSAQSEQPLADQVLGYSRRAVRPAATADYTTALTAEYITSTIIRVFLPRPATRKTVQLTLGSSVYTDDGSGVLVRSSGTFPHAALSIDYESGMIEGIRDSGTATVGSTQSGSVTFRPGAPFTGRSESYAIPVTLNNRSYNYVISFTETKPRPGTMIISYMALGKWVTITDPGNGILEGDGSGSINFTTGTVTVTLLALPDVGSSIVYAFLMDIAEEVEVHNGVIAGAIPEVEIQLSPGVDPGSVTIEYIADSLTKTLTDDGAGNLTGDGTGTIIYGTGEVSVKPDVIHDDGTDFDVTYTSVAPGTTTTDQIPIAGVITGTIPGAPLLSGSVTFSALMSRKAAYWGGSSISFGVRIQDDAAGGFIGRAGTINYTTGEYTLTIARLITLSAEQVNYTFSSSEGQFGRTKQTIGVTTITKDVREQVESEEITIAYQQASASHGADSTTHSPDQLTLLLIDNTDDLIIPGSVLFTYGGEKYYDRNGIVYQGFDSRTGAGQAVGTIDYTSRTVTLETWVGGSGPGVTIHAAATVASVTLVSAITGRTPSAPIRPQSFQITVTDGDGNIITDVADEDGVLSGASLSGLINYQTGIYDIWFTTDDQDLTGASDVPVAADTGLYNAVLFSFLPLDAELIGLDPVRLPSDGRVPIFREGDVLVLSHTTETDVGTPTAGTQTNLARDHQAAIEVVDSAGLKLDPAMYIGNLLTGVVTWADPLVLETADAVALTPPLTVRDRVEHMSVVNDVQINGTLSFIAPLAHQFPAEETIISSALTWGDINSRVFNFFTQQTWNSGTPNWGPERIGNDTTANYNIVDNPIEYANNGAITERWALVFTSSTAFNVVGQTLGIIATGNTSVDVIIENPNTGNPYFVMRAAGFGSGWAAGNVIRFDTEGCLAPLWICRTVLSGQAEQDDDRFVMQLRGDAD